MGNHHATRHCLLGIISCANLTPRRTSDVTPRTRVLSARSYRQLQGACARCLQGGVPSVTARRRPTESLMSMTSTAQCGYQLLLAGYSLAAPLSNDAVFASSAVSRLSPGGKRRQCSVERLCLLWPGGSQAHGEETPNETQRPPEPGSFATRHRTVVFPDLCGGLCRLGSRRRSWHSAGLRHPPTRARARMPSRVTKSS